MDDRLFVRCCCDPTLVLGFLPVAPRYRHDGCRLHYFLLAAQPVLITDESAEPPPHEAVVLEVAVAGIASGARELAIKSNDLPLDLLRRLPGFEEINQLIPVGVSWP